MYHTSKLSKGGGVSRRPSLHRARRPAGNGGARGCGDPPGDAATLAEIHDSVERARSYALLWLMMRDEILRSVDEMEQGPFRAGRRAEDGH
jgi:hypothetical protein